MPLISYIFYLPASRQDVFAQQLRLLEARENLGGCEAVVVWHGKPGQANLSAFGSFAIHSIENITYNKSILVNTAVGLSKGDILIILDSDRIMPSEYFERSVKVLSPKTAIAPLRMIKSMIDLKDEEIWEMNFPYKRDDRTEKLKPFRKHLFSGNTILFKKDYLEAGGMDESYWGYGYNDLDFGKTWETKGYKIHWSDAEELHLKHKRIDDVDPDEFYAQNSFNAYRFCRKWKEPIPKKFRYDLVSNAVPML
jgi:predicted glycosyltransferase involved in capsule biosynthesis